jgi:hypothetical protein
MGRQKIPATGAPKTPSEPDLFSTNPLTERTPQNQCRVVHPVGISQTRLTQEEQGTTEFTWELVAKIFVFPLHVLRTSPDSGLLGAPLEVV